MRSSLVLSAVGALLLVVAHTSAQSQRPPLAPLPEPSPLPAVTLPPANLEHGRYIVEHVAMCIECHSGRDQAGSIIPSERYLGGQIPQALPWRIDWATRAPRNKGLPGYDDALALRLLTQGAIGRDGAQLKAPMPRFRMTPQDAADVIAYLRSVR